MTENERGMLARDMGYEAAFGVVESIYSNSTHHDGTTDVGVYFAALAFAANALMAQLNAEAMLSTYPQAARRISSEDVGE